MDDGHVSALLDAAAAQDRLADDYERAGIGEFAERARRRAAAARTRADQAALRREQDGSRAGLRRSADAAPAHERG